MNNKSTRNNPNKKLSVVLVDDYRNERDVMAKTLLEQDDYYPVKLIRFADEAVEYCKNNDDPDDPPDISPEILLSVQQIIPGDHKESRYAYLGNKDNAYSHIPCK